MATYTGTPRTISRRFILPAAAATLAVAAVAGAGAWRATHSGTTKSAVTTVASVQQAQPQQSAVQAAAVPAPFGRVGGGSAVDNSLVLVASDAQASAVQQGIDQADAIRFSMGLAPLNASVVVTTRETADFTRQAIDAANVIRASLGVPPIQVVDLSGVRPAPAAETRRQSADEYMQVVLVASAAQAAAAEASIDEANTFRAKDGLGPLNTTVQVAPTDADRQATVQAVLDANRIRTSAGLPEIQVVDLRSAAAAAPATGAATTVLTASSADDTELQRELDELNSVRATLKLPEVTVVDLR
jgi:hypothetical protein